jgi:hypothetical protein
LENVTCLLVGFSIFFISIFPRPITSANSSLCVSLSSRFSPASRDSSFPLAEEVVGSLSVPSSRPPSLHRLSPQRQQQEKTAIKFPPPPPPPPRWRSSDVGFPIGI